MDLKVFNSIFKFILKMNKLLCSFNEFVSNKNCQKYCKRLHKAKFITIVDRGHILKFKPYVVRFLQCIKKLLFIIEVYFAIHAKECSVISER